MTIDIVTALCEAITLAMTMYGLRKLMRRQWESTKYPPGVMRILRICRYGSYAVGAVIILFGVYLSVTKAMYIRSLESTSGTITAVQESHITIAPYSFYVDYKIGSRLHHEFLHTFSPFSKKKGDTLTVLYDPTGKAFPEALLLDSDWLGYLTLLAAGGLAVWFSGWMYGWR